MRSIIIVDIAKLGENTDMLDRPASMILTLSGVDLL